LDDEAVSNAARHIAWQVYLTYTYGQTVAALIGQINEDKYVPNGRNLPGDPDRRADEHNNAIGQVIGLQLRREGQSFNPEELEQNIRDKVVIQIDEGWTVSKRLDQNGNLIPVKDCPRDP
jgi:hypothetical protein